MLSFSALSPKYLFFALIIQSKHDYLALAHIFLPPIFPRIRGSFILWWVGIHIWIGVVKISFCEEGFCSGPSILDKQPLYWKATNPTLSPSHLRGQFFFSNWLREKVHFVFPHFLLWDFLNLVITTFLICLDYFEWVCLTKMMMLRLCRKGSVVFPTDWEKGFIFFPYVFFMWNFMNLLMITFGICLDYFEWICWQRWWCLYPCVERFFSFLFSLHLMLVYEEVICEIISNYLFHQRRCFVLCLEEAICRFCDIFWWICW